MDVTDLRSYNVALERINELWDVHTLQAQQELDDLIFQTEMFEEDNFKERNCYLPGVPANYYGNHSVYTIVVDSYTNDKLTCSSYQSNFNQVL